MDIPLYVDLDGTLICGDLLWDSFTAVLKRSPLSLLRIPVWARDGGRARVKHELAVRASLDASVLTYRASVMDFLQAEHARGRRLVLATAADQSLAMAVARRVGLFSSVLASDGQRNLKGASKLALIRDGCPGPFAYVGDSPADLPIWRAAREAYVVEPSPTLLRRMGISPPPVTVGTRGASELKGIWRLIRPQQWVKNLLVFLPVLCAHQAGDPHRLAAATIGFVCLSLCASSVYVQNDLLDVSDDRRNPANTTAPPLPNALHSRW